MQHIREQITRSNLNRIPAQCLADLRHRNTQQRAGIALAHLAEFVTVLNPVSSSSKTCYRSSYFTETPKGRKNPPLRLFFDIYFSKYVGAFARAAILIPSIGPTPESRSRLRKILLSISFYGVFERFVNRRRCAENWRRLCLG